MRFERCVELAHAHASTDRHAAIDGIDLDRAIEPRQAEHDLRAAFVGIGSTDKDGMGALRNDRIALLPIFLFGDELDSGRLIEVSPRVQSRGRHYVVTPTQRESSAAAKAFVEWILEQAT